MVACTRMFACRAAQESKAAPGWRRSALGARPNSRKTKRRGRTHLRRRLAAQRPPVGRPRRRGSILCRRRSHVRLVLGDAHELGVRLNTRRDCHTRTRAPARLPFTAPPRAHATHAPRVRASLVTDAHQGG